MTDPQAARTRTFEDFVAARETLRPDPLTNRIHAALEGECSGTHSMGYATCQRVAAALRAVTPDPAEPGLREAIARLAVGDPEWPLHRVLALAHPEDPA